MNRDYWTYSFSSSSNSLLIRFNAILVDQLPIWYDDTQWEWKMKMLVEKNNLEIEEDEEKENVRFHFDP